MLTDPYTQINGYYWKLIKKIIKKISKMFYLINIF
jgi:hypothetical protein